MKEDTATIIGFAVAPIFPGLMVGLGTPITRDGPSLMTVLGLFPVGYLVSASFMGLFGVPLFLLARRSNLVRWWSAIIAGSAIGIGASLIMQLPNVGPLTSSGNLIYASTGALAVFAFWLIWRLGRSG